MPLCESVPATVDTDLNVLGAYLTDLDKCMKNFNESLSSTLNAYRNLLTAFDQVGQVYGNIGQTCSPEVNGTTREFRDGMRDLKDKGGFEVFNNEIMQGTMAMLDPIKQDLKRAMKSYKDVKSKQKAYDTARYDLDKKEKSYASTQKSLAESQEYQKTMARRDKTKETFETRKAAFGQEVQALQSSTDNALLQSFNNYLHCTASFCGRLEVTMTSYRTDVSNKSHSNANRSSMDRLKDKAMQDSSSRRSKRESNATSMPAERKPPMSHNSDAEENINRYPTEDSAPSQALNPLNGEAQQDKGAEEYE